MEQEKLMECTTKVLVAMIQAGYFGGPSSAMNEVPRIKAALQR